MKSFKTMTNALLLAAGLASGVGLTARAQTITLNGSIPSATAAQVGGGGLQYACTAYAPASPNNLQTFVFTPGANNEVIDKWMLQGDGVATTGTTGTTFSFSPIGFGKARVTVGYYYNNGTTPVFCPAGSTTPLLCNSVAVTTPIRTYTTRTYDFFKVFTQAQAGITVKGPTCVPVNNPSVVYQVDPAVISQVSQIQGALGVDDYTWSVNYVNPAGIVPFTYSGDRSAIIILGGPIATSDLKRSFTVSVQVGKCNAPSALLPVTVASDINAAATLTGFPACVPVGTLVNQTFTLNTVAGVNYTVSTNGGNITATPASIAGNGSPATITLTGFTATNSTVVTIVGTATGSACFGTQTIVKAVNRQLVPAQNLITPTCVAPNATGVLLTMSNAPAGATWSVPAGSGWTITSQTGNTATVNTGAAGTSVTVTTGNCGVDIVQPISVTGPVAGCTFPVTLNAGCGAYVSTPTGTCPTSGNKYVQWKLEEQTSPGVWTQRDLVSPVGAAQNANTVAFFGWTSSIASPNARVTVRVTNASNCLDASYTYVGAFTTCGPRFFPQPGVGSSSSSSALLREQVQVYPNPAGSQLSIDLNADLSKGAATVRLVDALGRVHQTMTTDQARTTLDVGRVAEGLYTLRVELPTGTVLTQPVQVHR